MGNTAAEYFMGRWILRLPRLKRGDTAALKLGGLLGKALGLTVVERAHIGLRHRCQSVKNGLLSTARAGAIA